MSFKISVIFLYLILLQSFLFGSSQISDPLSLAVGARALGMGKASVAVYNDGTSIFTNASCMEFEKRLKIVSMAGNFLSEVPYGIIGVAIPTKKGTFGIGYVRISISGIEETTLSGATPEATGNNATYSNSALVLSYSIPFSNIKIKNIKEVKAGISLKSFNQNYNGTSAFTAGNSNGSSSAKIFDKTVVGVVVKNILPGNNIYYQNGVGVDELPTLPIIGVSHRLDNPNMLLALDIEGSKNVLFHFGAEYIRNDITFRGGLDQTLYSGAPATNWTFGFGGIFNGMSFDYAYHTYFDIPEFSTHFFSIGYLGRVATDEVRTQENIDIKKKEENIERPKEPFVVPSK